MPSDPSRSHPPVAAKAAWKVQLFALAAGTVVAAWLAEVSLRIHNPIFVQVRGNHIVLPVNKRFLFKNPTGNDKLEAEITCTWNQLGFRGPNPPADPAAYLRIIAIGGSTTLCEYLSDDKTWPELLNRRLQGDLKRPVWVNNAGFDGHSTFGHLHLLQQAVLDLRPDYVLFLVGINDVGLEGWNSFDRRLDPRSDSLRNRIIAKSELLSTLLALSRTWRAFELGLGHDWELELARCQRATVSPETVERAVAEHRGRYLPAYEDRLEEIVKLCRERGIEPVLMTQPVLYGDTVDPATGVDIGPLLHGDKTAAERWHVLEAYNEVTLRVGRHRDIVVVDLAHEMPKDSRLYYDWTHFTRAGAERVADRVARGIEPLLLKRDPGRGRTSESQLLGSESHPR